MSRSRIFGVVQGCPMVYFRFEKGIILEVLNVRSQDGWTGIKDDKEVGDQEGRLQERVKETIRKEERFEILRHIRNDR